MKRVSSIRNGLAEIEGALGALPPNPGYDGSEEAVQSAWTLWWGENPNLVADYRDANGIKAALEEEVADDEVFGVGDGDQWFDPVFEIGAEVDERFPGLGGESGRKIQQSVELHGMEALGWYVPFHHPGLQWGIYIPISGMAYLVREAFGWLGVSFETKLHLAFHAILNHELFHFATEYAIAQAELTHVEPWYVPAKRGMHATSPGYCVEEERLANAYMLSAFRSMKPALRVAGKQAALRTFVSKQPEGYREALDVRPSHWDGLLEELSQRYGALTKRSADHPFLWFPRLGYDWPRLFPIRPRIDWRYCPIHLVDDSVRLGIPPAWLSCFYRLSAIEETEEFTKKLKKLAPPIQRAWMRSKERLSVAITSGADFKKWDKGGKDLFSVRINDNFRAHLRRREETDDWLAVEIGSHKEMGHG
jgi:hypothetical protein